MLSVASNTPTVHHHYKTISPPATNANSRSPRRLLKKVTKTWKNCNVFSRSKVKAVGNLIRKNSAQFIGCQKTSENNENKESKVRKDSSPEEEESAVVDDKSTDKLILSDCEEVSEIYNKSLGEKSAESESSGSQVNHSDSKKRKRSVFGGRLANATKLLKENNSSAMAIKQLPEEDKGVTVNFDQAAAAVANVVDPYQHQHRDPSQHFWSEYNQSHDQEENKREEPIYNSWGEDEWPNFYSDFEPIPERPHYMSGFPNPPGENRCWLNATLHALFVLPLIDNIHACVVKRLSKLTRTLVAMQMFWRSGSQKMEVMHQTVKKFKEELAILDASYPEEKQQDVSEFLMILLNYVKTECEQLSADTPKTEEVENVPENRQDLSKDTRAPLTPSKRPPLAILSPLKSSNGNTKAIAENSSTGDSAAKTKVEKTLNNPIDDCFLLPMREHYICEGCNEHRQRDIDNMMLYVPLPDNESNNNDEVTVIPADAPATPPPINLSVAINKSMEPEERCLTCTKCKSTKHHRSTSFRGCPNVLTVQINRYGVNNDGYCSKINTPVEIPAELSVEITNNDGTSTGENGNQGDGNPPTSTVHKFQPVCIIAHVGSAMDCGHYTSYAKHNNQWFHYNDMDVMPMSEADALDAAQRTAYLVFFINVKSSASLTSESSDLNLFNTLSVKLDDNPSQ